MDNSAKHTPKRKWDLKRYIVRGMDVLVLSGLAFLVVIHFEYQEPRAGASREAYDRYMREFVLEHNMADLRKQAIEARLDFRNAEWEHTRRTQLTVWVTVVIFMYGFWRLLIFRS